MSTVEPVPVVVPNFTTKPQARAIVHEANYLLAPLKGNYSAMAKRRFQNPTPFREGKWWWIVVRVDVHEEGRLKRKPKRLKLGPAKMLEREAQKIASEMLRPMNQGTQTIGSATLFGDYVEIEYKPVVLLSLAKSTQSNYGAHLERYLLPVFKEVALRDMNALALQRYFTNLGVSKCGPATVLKIKETLSSVLNSAVGYELLSKNPMPTVKIPRSKILNRKKTKPHLTPEEFERMVAIVREPYATMIYTAVYSGLRPSELNGLRADDVHDDSIVVDERCCRGDWSVTKTEASSNTISVPAEVVARIRRLKDMEVELHWGGKGAKRRVKVTRSQGPEALVFQGLQKGGPMRDSNILRRHLRPAALKLGIDPKKVTWQALRRAYGTFMIEAGANAKDVQAQMRHSRISTTMDIYAQRVPESQRQAVAKMVEMMDSRRQKNEASNHVALRSNSNPVLGGSASAEAVVSP